MIGNASARVECGNEVINGDDEGQFLRATHLSVPSICPNLLVTIAETPVPPPRRHGRKDRSFARGQEGSSARKHDSKFTTRADYQRRII